MASHPNITHFDAVDPIVLDHTELKGRRTRFGPAGGAYKIGLSRYQLGPGERAMPVHVHADEEEHFYVLGGSGYSYQDGKTHRIGEGDMIVYLAQGPAHTVIAGDEGLDVLAFGSGSDTGMTWLPRAQSWWMGPHWLPHDAPNPFKREVQAGPLVLPEPEPGTAANIASRHKVPPNRTEDRGYHETYWSLAAAAGSILAGCHYADLDEGQIACPQHWHSAEEECFVVLDGQGEALLDDEVFPLVPGSILFCPPTAHIAHTVRGGPGGMRYLCYGTRRADEFCWYPRSKKLNFGGRVIMRVELVDYQDGEEL